MQFSTCGNNYPKHKVEKCEDAASSPSQWPCWVGKQQKSLQLADMKGGPFPTSHITLLVAQYLLGLFIGVRTPAGCCPLLLKNSPQKTEQGKCDQASVPGVLA